jgi:hypothetical protein
LKALATALLGYFYLVALIPAWMPGNARYFSVFFACGGCCAAYFLPPWRLSIVGNRLLFLMCALMMLHTCLFGIFPLIQ